MGLMENILAGIVDDILLLLFLWLSGTGLHGSQCGYAFLIVCPR